MPKKCTQIFDEFLQVIHQNIVGEDKAIIDILNTLGIEQANDLIGAAFLKHFKFMHLEQWQRYPLNMVSTDIIDEQGENVIHKCVRYDKIDFLKHIPSIGFNLGIPNKDGDTPLHLAYKKLIYAQSYPAFTKAKNTLLNIVNFKNKDEISSQFMGVLINLEHIFKPIIDFNYNVATFNHFMHHKPSVPILPDINTPINNFKPLLPRITLPRDITSSFRDLAPPGHKRKTNSIEYNNTKKHKTISNYSHHNLYSSIENKRLDNDLNSTSKTTTTTSYNELDKLLIAFSNTNNASINNVLDTDEVALIGNKFI